MSAQFHGAFPSMIGGGIVSWGDKSCEASYANSILGMARSILLLSACKSWLQWDIGNYPGTPIVAKHGAFSL